MPSSCQILCFVWFILFIPVNVAVTWVLLSSSTDGEIVLEKLTLESSSFWCESSCSSHHFNILTCRERKTRASLFTVASSASLSLFINGDNPQRWGGNISENKILFMDYKKQSEQKWRKI